jgi:hypothetical protein
LVFELTFERMSTSVSDSDSFEIDSFIGVKTVVRINGSGQIRNINSGVRFSGNEKIVGAIFGITIEKCNHGLQIYFSSSVVVPLLHIRIRESDTRRRLKINNRGIQIPRVIIIL